MDIKPESRDLEIVTTSLFDPRGVFSVGLLSIIVWGAVDLLIFFLSTN